MICLWKLNDERLKIAILVLGLITTTVLSSVDVSNSSIPSLLELIAETPELSKLNSYLVISNISIPEPVTFFAPTDDAFAKVCSTSCLNRFALPRWYLHREEIINVHFTGDGTFTSSMIEDGQVFEMGNGENGRTEILDTGIVISTPGTYQALITSPDYAILENGVLHLTDQLLLPSFASKTLDMLANSTTDISTFASLVALVPGLNDIIASYEFTILAPLNKYFDELDPDFVAYLTDPANVKVLNETLTYHMLLEVLPSDQIVDRSYETLSGKTVTANTCKGLDFNGVTVAQANLLAFNGIIHTINGILSPDAVAPQASPVASPVADPPTPKSRRRPRRRLTKK